VCVCPHCAHSPVFTHVPQFGFTLPAGTNPGTYTITLILTDAINPALTDERTISVSVVPGSRRREAPAATAGVALRSTRSANGIDAFTTRLTITGNVLSASMDQVTRTAYGSGFTPRESQSGASKNVAIAAGAAAGVVLLAAVVAVAVRRSKHTAAGANRQVLELVAVEAVNESTA
jgi:hypothetical protein